MMFYLWFDRQLAGKLGCTATDPAEILLFLQKTNVIGRRVNALPSQYNLSSDIKGKADPLKDLTPLNA
jgi:hypothetical protein